MAAAAGHRNHDQLTTNSGVHCSHFELLTDKLYRQLEEIIALHCESPTHPHPLPKRNSGFVFVAHKDKCKNKLTQIFGSDKNQQLPGRR